MKTKQEIKKWFENGDIPNQEQFWDWQDSYWHKDEIIPSNSIDIDLSEKADLIGGKVPASQLPSYVDDVIEFASLSVLPVQGESSKIYVTTDNNNLYRWTGTQYINITQGDVGTLQAVTDRGSETTKNVKIQDVYIGGLESAQNIVIGDESLFVNNNAGGTIAIGKNTKPVGIDHLVIGNTALADNTDGSIGNTAVGNFAMMQAPNSSENAVFGYNAFSSASNAFANVVVGPYSGQFSGESLTQNTIYGYSSGCNLGAHSTNNIIIGAQSAFGNASLQNKLFIHSSTSATTKVVSDALISGDFNDRYVNINGKFSVTPGQMPSSDNSFTKNVVAKPDGTFGWENKIEYLPLTGAPSTKPVTGDIFIKNSSNYTQLATGYILCSDLSDNGTIVTNSSVKFLEANQGTADFTKTGITTVEGEFVITCYKTDARGLTGYYDYTKNIGDLDYVQKKYVDKKRSFSTTEETTDAKWIDGKPIYRKTIVYDTIPSTGEIDITVDFVDAEMIVSNQMFTEWHARDIVFAGNHWRGQIFITLQNNMLKIEDVNNIDYSIIDSITLTLEYTKSTD